MQFCSPSLKLRGWTLPSFFLIEMMWIQPQSDVMFRSIKIPQMVLLICCLQLRKWKKQKQISQQSKAPLFHSLRNPFVKINKNAIMDQNPSRSIVVTHFTFFNTLLDLSMHFFNFNNSPLSCFLAFSSI